ncbi:unnamed protein product, partial [Ascophyllum nodosum]
GAEAHARSPVVSATPGTGPSPSLPTLSAVASVLKSFTVPSPVVNRHQNQQQHQYSDGVAVSGRAAATIVTPSGGGHHCWSWGVRTGRPATSLYPCDNRSRKRSRYWRARCWIHRYSTVATMPFDRYGPTARLIALVPLFSTQNSIGLVQYTLDRARAVSLSSESVEWR